MSTYILRGKKQGQTKPDNTIINLVLIWVSIIQFYLSWEIFLWTCDSCEKMANLYLSSLLSSKHTAPFPCSLSSTNSKSITVQQQQLLAACKLIPCHSKNTKNEVCATQCHRDLIMLVLFFYSLTKLFAVTWHQKEWNGECHAAVLCLCKQCGTKGSRKIPERNTKMLSTAIDSVDIVNYLVLQTSCNIRSNASVRKPGGI